MNSGRVGANGSPLKTSLRIACFAASTLTVAKYADHASLGVGPYWSANLCP
jgi:hypothetical protein